MLIFGAVVCLIWTSVNVCATSDATGDLFHTTDGLSWEKYTGNDNIDITDVSYTTSDTQLTVTLTIAGTIQDDYTYGYWVYVANTGTEGYDYFGSYTNGIGYVFDTTPTEHQVTKDTHTLTFVFDLDNPANVERVYAWAYQDGGYDNPDEIWVDWAPDTYFPAYDTFYGSDNNTTTDDDTAGDDTGDNTTGGDDSAGNNESSAGNGTPGFEMIAILAAITVALLLFKRRK